MNITFSIICRITGTKNVKVKIEPVETNTPPEDIDIGGLNVEPLIKEELKVEMKEEPMEDQVTAAIETSSELTAALESIG